MVAFVSHYKSEGVVLVNYSLVTYFLTRNKLHAERLLATELLVYMLCEPRPRFKTNNFLCILADCLL